MSETKVVTLPEAIEIIVADLDETIERLERLTDRVAKLERELETERRLRLAMRGR
jgi:ubiquinone biosynthesis protein UbiJ